MSPANRQFANFITARRTERGLTLPQLAEEIGVSKSNLYYWEAAQWMPKTTQFEPLARALGVDYEDLYALAGYTSPEVLPAFTPYLRTKYGELPEEALAEAEAFFENLTRRYDSEEEDGDAESDR